MTKLAIITVNYENYSVTQEFLSYFQQTDDYKVFISDLSKNRQKINTNSFTEIIIGQNKGYAHGVNLGLRKALMQGFDRFVIINNDTRINKDFIDKVTKSLNQNPKSLIGGKIYYEKGYEYHKNKYNKENLGKIIWYAGGIIDWKNMITKHRGVDEADQGQYDKLEKTEFITGCFMCFDIEALEKIGFWNEVYFLYYEDADYCVKAKRKNINLLYDPSISIWHKNAQSTGGSGSLLHQKYQEKNRLAFGLKYAPFRTKFYLLKNYFINNYMSFRA